MDGNIQPATEVAAPEPAKRVCLLVLGMHRSGTSALTRVLSFIGATLPERLIGATESNKQGHWEPALVNVVNEQILAETGSRWDDWRSVDWSSLPAHRRFHFKSEISRNIELDYANAPLFVLKEPRICRLVPIYLDVLRELDVDVRIVIPFRNPISVGASLQTRDGLHPQISELFWIRHVLDAERDSRGLSRTFIDYDKLVSDWPSTVEKLSGELQLTFAETLPDAKGAVDEFLRPEHRHHQSSHQAVARSAIVSEWSKTVFAALGELEQDAASADAQDKLDDVRDRFDRSVTLFGTHFAKLKRERDETEQSRALLEAQLVNLEATIAGERLAIAEQISALTLHSEQVAGSLAEVSGELEASRASLQSTHEALERTQVSLESTHAELEQARASFESTHDELEQTRASVLLAQEELEQTKTGLESTHAELEQARASFAGINSEAEQARAALAAAENELQAREILLATARETLADLQLEKTQLGEQFIDLAAGQDAYKLRLADAEGRLQQSETDRQALDSALSEASARLESRTAETASLLLARDHALAQSAHLAARLSEAEQQVREANAVIHALRASTSWKVTKPLRALKRIRARMNEGRDLALVRESGLFDRAWYVGAYADVDPSRIDPLLHFVRFGGMEGRSPSPHFDSRHYLLTNRDVADKQVNPLVHYLRFGRAEMRPPLPQARIAPPAAYPVAVTGSAGLLSPPPIDADTLRMDAAFEALSTDLLAPVDPAQPFVDDDCKLIAFYLPQFHRVRENSEWWSPGFTEWTNVARGRPNFSGHHQPHIPRELGYYDLSSPATLREQADMARLYGISGFCFYHYWFSGRRILERPVEQFLESDIDLKFCLCWANENWTRTWDGDTKSVLLAQEYGDDDALAFITDILPALRDRRCIQIDGKPLLLVYRAKEIPDARGWFDLWRRVAVENGLTGLHIAVVDFYDISRPDEVGADSLVEFPPHKFNGQQNHPDPFPAFTNPDFAGGVVDYVRMIVQSAKRPVPDFQLFRGIIPSWDNTARRQNTPTIILNARPDLFGAWLTFLRRYTRLSNAKPDRRLVFINAWNEWGEGCHLEPDMKWGLSYLEETLTSSLVSATQPAFSLEEAAAALQFDLAIRLPDGTIGPDMPEDVPTVPPEASLKSVGALFQDHEIPGPMVLMLSSALRRWPRVHAAVRRSYRQLRQFGRTS